MIESIITTFNISGGDSIVNPACAFYQVWYFYYYFIIYFSYGPSSVEYYFQTSDLGMTLQIAVERNFTRGRKTDQVAAACLYIACR